MRTVAMLAVMAMAVLSVSTGVAGAADPPETAVTIENNRFNPEEIKVKANAPFVIVVTNKDKTPEEFESKELKIEKVVPPGQTVKIRVRALKPGTYPFIGEYHEKTAKGRIVAE